MFARRQPPPGSGLQVCRVCRADYVFPVSWEEVDDDHWNMLLRCAECETFRRVVVGNEVAKRYEDDLQRGTDEIATALERSDRARMLVQVDSFVTALERDLIDPTDFASR